MCCVKMIHKYGDIHSYMLKILGKYNFMIFFIVDIACLNSMTQYREGKSAVNYSTDLNV